MTNMTDDLTSDKSDITSPDHVTHDNISQPSREPDQDASDDNDVSSVDNETPENNVPPEHGDSPQHHGTPVDGVPLQENPQSNSSHYAKTTRSEGSSNSKKRDFSIASLLGLRSYTKGMGTHIIKEICHWGDP